MVNNILEIHPSKNAVSVPQQYQLNVPVTPHLLNGFLSDPELRNDHADYMHTCDFLIMPVHVSPLLCAIQKLSWRKRYVDSFESISILRLIIQCFRVNPHLPGDKKRIREAHDWMIEETNKLEMALVEQLEELTDDNLEGFITIMEQSTLRRIRILEETIWRMFSVGKVFPLAACLTPLETPNLTEGLPEMRRVTARYLETKQLLRNIRAEKALPEGNTYQPVNYFDLGAIKEGRRENLHRNHIDPETAREYKLFLKL